MQKKKRKEKKLQYFLNKETYCKGKKWGPLWLILSSVVFWAWRGGGEAAFK